MLRLPNWLSSSTTCTWIGSSGWPRLTLSGAWRSGESHANRSAFAARGVRTGSRALRILPFSEEHALLAHQIDHVIAEKRGGATSEDNLALSCQQCNAHKGSDIASVDAQTASLTPLFNPRMDVWSEHFTLVDGVMAPKTATGRVTVALLHLNDPERVEERRVLGSAGVDQFRQTR
jgi:hypothetical protein